jgi:hypothetical protein
MRQRRQALVLVAVFALIAAAAGLVGGGGSAAAASQPMLIVTGAGAGGGPHVRVFRGDGTDTGVGFYAYDAAFAGGVRVGTGDLNGDGNDEIITGAGAGGGPHVRAFSQNGAPFQNISFMAYDPSFSGGVFVAAGDLFGDGQDEIVTGAGAGGGPHVRVFRYDKDQNVLTAVGGGFMAYNPAFPGGVHVAVADVDHDGKDEIITGAGPSGGPQVSVFKYAPDGTVTATGTSFMAFSPQFPGGAFVGGAHSKGAPDIITGAGPSGGPEVAVFQANNSLTSAFYAYDPGFPGGVHVAGGDVDGNGNNNIVTGAGEGGGPHVRVFDINGAAIGGGFYAYSPSFGGGVYVALAHVAGPPPTTTTTISPCVTTTTAAATTTTTSGGTTTTSSGATTTTTSAGATTTTTTAPTTTTTACTTTTTAGGTTTSAGGTTTTAGGTTTTAGAGAGATTTTMCVGVPPVCPPGG